MKYFLLGAAAWLAAFASAPMAWAQQQGGAPYGYGPHMWGWGGGWFFGPLMMLVFIAAAAAVVVLVIRWLGGGTPAPPHASGKAPLDILNERFARGEIDKDEFEDRRRVLGE